jgi:hypothetical protein
MAVGRISGPLLKQNLLREGVDLAFETDLLYLDVNNNRIGINKTNPQFDLDVNGIVRTPTVEATTFADITGVQFSGDTISTTNSTLTIGTGDNVVYQNRLEIDDINLENNVISTDNTNANIEFRPNGTGSVEVHSDMNVTGNIFATGNITADGEITIGDADTDFITFNAEVNSNIIPDIDNTYNLGSDPDLGGKQWGDVYVQNFFAGTIDTTGLIVDGIDLNLRPGNTIFVAENGDDASSGDHPQAPYASVVQALTTATAGDTVYIMPGVYTEVFPLTIPTGVNVHGHSLRSVTIQPTAGTVTNDAFILNGETTVEELTITGFNFDSGNNTGYAFKFNSTFQVNSRSPYIRNVSVITTGTTTTAEDPRGFNTGDAGKGAYLDGSSATPASKEAACLFHAVTFITPGVDAVTFTNGVRIEWLNCFTYFANRGVYCVDGTDGKASVGKTALRVSDLTGTLTQGETVTYYDTDGVTVLATSTVESVDADNKFYVSGKVTGFETAEERPGKQVTANGDAQLDTSIKKFGTASLQVDGTGDYASIQPQNDFGFGTGDFTIETWIYLPSTPASNNVLIDLRAALDSDVAPMLKTSNGSLYYFTDNANKITAAGAISATTWHHIALTRNGTDTKLFVDGTQAGTTYTDNNDYGPAKPLTIGAAHDASDATTGHFDDVRVIKGTAIYTANFTAPTVNLYATPTTVLLLRFNGVDESTTFEDEVIYAQDIRFSGGATATRITLADYTDFGAEVRMIGSASVYGNYGIWGDGPGVIVYAIGQNLAYIGNGKEVTNDATTVIQSNEVVELNNAKVRYNSVDHKGDFRVGDLFYVNQETGVITFTSSNFNVSAGQGLTFTDGGNTTFVDGNRIDTGNLRLSGNTLESLSGDVNVTSASDQINLNNNVNITGNLDVTGNVTIGGDITIGDEASDAIEFIAGINSDIVPAQNSTYSLGTPSRIWKNIWANQAEIDDIRITQNYITTTATNANLELRSSGTGSIVIDNLTVDDITVSSTSDINLAAASGYVKIQTTGAIKLPTGTTAERPAVEPGIVRFNTQLNRFEGYDGSDWIQLNGVIDLDGDTQIRAEQTQGANDNIIRFDIAGTTVADLNGTRLAVPRLTVDDIEIDTNVITTVTTDTDLELKAQGTGSVLLENFAFDDNKITNTVTDSITQFVSTGNGYVKIDGTNGVVIPVGTNLNRPAPAFTEVGMLRFNTSDGRVEAYDGLQWGSVAGQTGAITTIDAGFLAVETVLYLG